MREEASGREIERDRDNNRKRDAFENEGMSARLRKKEIEC